MRDFRRPVRIILFEMLSSQTAWPRRRYAIGPFMGASLGLRMVLRRGLPLAWVPARASMNGVGVRGHARAESLEARHDRLAQLGEARSAGRRDPEAAGVERLGGRPVGLVVREEDAALLDAELLENLLGDGLLLGRRRRGRVDDVDEEVRVAHLGERGLEGRHEVVRELPEKPDRVREDDRAPADAVQAGVPRIERREQAVLGEFLRGREPVEERRLPRVRVPDEGDRRDALQALAAHVALRLDLPELVLELRDPHAEPPAVELDLPLARAPAERAAAALLREPLRLSREPRA